ncbi:MepB family protein [uncultured Kordia sp.]|uniref:MepB family protein n=1 Tax=uncultured Kordia sp. TaxID=507699 RepID=UPI00260933EE|nr:MepB family protein [uncultured Kordia sp.]
MKITSEKFPYCIAKIKESLYDSCNFHFSNFCSEEESTAYEACSFQLETYHIISRTAKITPKKIGQFVTVWKRNVEGITAPFHETDTFDFIVINVQKEQQFGQFVFPKSILIQKQIVATELKDGKRGIRVYPSWDKPTSKQAIKTQAWQLRYFLMLNTAETVLKTKLLYGI